MRLPDKGPAGRALYRRAAHMVLRPARAIRNAISVLKILPADADDGAAMAPQTIRKLAGILSVVVALLTAIMPPAAYFVTGYLHTAKSALLTGRMAARQTSHFLGVDHAGGRAGFSALMRGFHEATVPITNTQQRLFDSQAYRIAETGELPQPPVYSHHTPIMHQGLTVGSIETATSLRPLISETIAIAVLGAMLGLLVYVAASRLPMRELNRTLKELHQRRRELATQNMRFNAALNNMSQGLCMFDADQKLVVSNQRWAQIYDLKPEHVLPGTPFRAILEDRVKQGVYAGEAPDCYVDERLAAVSEGISSTKVQELTDGRIISISHQPMSDGGWVATHEDITEQRRIEERIAHMAHHDTLTNLPNRALLRERLEEAFLDLEDGNCFALLWLDLDRFKSINDNLGHPVGDELLKAVAKRLQASLESGDTVARPGGDEFAIIHRAFRSRAGTIALADKIIRALRTPFDLSNHRVTIDTSIGIVIAPHHGRDTDGVLSNADIALYNAKNNGRGNYCIFDSSMVLQMKQRRAIELDLRDALVRNEFEMHYQPLISLRDDRISGFEALLRWVHPERGLVSPDEFIPVAEEAGMIVSLGEWALRQACAQAAIWPDDIKVAVNLSPVQFRSGRIVETVINTLASTGLQPHRLELEITEFVLLSDDKANLETLHRLRELGVRIAMDDFGTGYSSLSYLRSFPFDKIKIDRSFITDIDKGEDAVAIVRAVTGLGQRLGIATVAEGVETEGQKEMVRALGCSEMQGYLFSRPRPARELGEYIGIPVTGESVPRRASA